MNQVKIKYFLIIHLLLLITIHSNCFSQEKKEITLRDRLFFGGNIGLLFGSVTDIEIAPIVGYRFTSHWSAGIGIKYEYYAASNIFVNYKTSIYGGSVFTEYLVLKDVISRGLSLMVHVEDESLSLEKKYFSDNYLASGRYVLNSVLVGGGIKQYMGGRISMYTILLLNLNETTYSPYQSPILKVGINF